MASYRDFLDALGERESGGDYGVVNTLGYLGRYQFGELGLIDVGYYTADDRLKGGNGAEAGMFRSGQAKDGDDHILYDRATGELRYDADGNGDEDAITIAIIAGHDRPTHDDIVVASAPPPPSIARAMLSGLVIRGSRAYHCRRASPPPRSWPWRHRQQGTTCRAHCKATGASSAPGRMTVFISRRINALRQSGF